MTASNMRGIQSDCHMWKCVFIFLWIFIHWHFII